MVDVTKLFNCHQVPHLAARGRARRRSHHKAEKDGSHVITIIRIPAGIVDPKSLPKSVEGNPLLGDDHGHRGEEADLGGVHEFLTSPRTTIPSCGFFSAYSRSVRSPNIGTFQPSAMMLASRAKPGPPKVENPPVMRP